MEKQELEDRVKELEEYSNVVYEVNQGLNQDNEELRRLNNTLGMQLEAVKHEVSRLEALLYQLGSSKAVKEARIAKIRLLSSQGKNVTDISREVFGYTGGYAYEMVVKALNGTT